jgi:LytS/YehU family sensor histidine kinase
MNPHFLYNVLNTVQGLVYDNRKAEAGNLLGNFSDLMRKTLESSEKQMHTVRDEMENLRLYLELEKARFNEDFSYSIHFTGNTDPAQLMIPSLLLQPLAENAVKHGLLHKQGAKMLDIGFTRLESGFRVIIEDNGIGRKQSMIINARNQKKPASFATRALEDRIALFNRLYEQQIVYEVMDKADETGRAAGTRIELIIPEYPLT